jgi:asparagine synthase (glutamine-hydrolysing)
MCGIIGAISRSRSTISRASFDTWRDRLTHRGPDKGATIEDRGLFLGFRRLSILDLREAAGQPMTTPDGRWTIVFNGEIYNYRELRSSLERDGVCFKTESDTEVLLALISRKGIDCLNELNGMFAFAVYDSLKRTVLLVRDRMGVKPLYYMYTPQTLAFASEIRAITDVPGFPTTIDEKALAIYFKMGMVPHWSSIYPGVLKVPPGTWIRFNLDDFDPVEPTRYWDLPDVAEDDSKSEDEWLDEIDSTLLDATRLRLRADVPIGIFLSGGIDSGLVAAAAARIDRQISCFTVSFPGAAEDELPLAQAAACHLGLKLVKLEIDAHRGISELPKVMGHFDEPLADLSALPTALICEEARKHLVVVLSGDAGDEVFAGYRNHVRAWKWRNLDLAPKVLKQIAAVILKSATVSDSLLHRFANRLREPVGRFGVGTMLYPFGEWQNIILNQKFTISSRDVVELFNKNLPSWNGASALDQAQRTDMRSYLLDDILIKIDRMSMRHSIELRSPFLDYRMIELGLRIPSKFRVRYGQNKYLLRRLAERYLPSEVVKARKRGFGIPIKSWIKEPSVSQTLIGGFMSHNEGTLGPFKCNGTQVLLENSFRTKAGTSALMVALAFHWWSNSKSNERDR